jgi:hypothetical protein
MSDMEEVKGAVSTADDAGENRQQPAAHPERLASLPLDALLYYVFYGDDGLRRLT